MQPSAIPAWPGTLPHRRPAPVSAAATLTSIAAFAALALLLRLPFLGNPVQHIDEQFYLMVAERWAQGAALYAEIWDRKPPGLFLIYRAALAVPGDPVIAAQMFGLVATVIAACAVEALARMIASPVGSRLAGLAYIGFMPVFGCGYAQSPVFFNPLVALAALMTIRLVTSPAPARLAARGALVMLLLGLAMQVKYTALFEGIGLGLMLLARARADGLGLPRLLGLAAGWVAVAIAPTALAWGLFAAAGHGAAFWQANFVSVFLKTQGDGRELIRLAQMALILSPFAVAMCARPASAPDRAAHLRIRLWFAAAFIGYCVFGKWYDHYAAPLLAPLAVLAAPMLGERGWYKWLLGFVALAANTVTLIDRLIHDGTPAQAHRAAARIAAALDGGCLYQFQGQSVLYRLTGACIPTRYPFPDHLATTPEAPALGRNPVLEIRRIMAAQPAVVLVDNTPRPYMQNPLTRRVVDAVLARDYQPQPEIVIGTHHYGFWRLRRAAPPRPGPTR